MGDFLRGGDVTPPLVQGSDGIDGRGRGENLRGALEELFPQIFDPARHVPLGDQGENKTGDDRPQSSAPDTPPDPPPVTELGSDPPKVDSGTVGSPASAPPVPEPSTWMMILLSFVGAGLMCLNHRKTA